VIDWSTPVRISGIEGVDGTNGTDGTDGTNGTDGVDGAQGPSPVYQGEYLGAKTYYGTGTRVDIAKYLGTYYVARSDAGTFSGILPTNTAYWNTFGATFDSVATDLLFASLAYIENLGVQNLKTATTGPRIEMTAASNSMRFINSLNSTIVTIDDDLSGGGVGGILINDGVINSSGGNNNAAGIFESGTALLGTTQTIRAKVGTGSLIPSQHCALYAGDGFNLGDSRAIVCDGDIEIKDDLIFKGAVFENVNAINQSTAYTMLADNYMVVQSGLGDVNLPSLNLSLGRSVVVARRLNSITVNGNGKNIIFNGVSLTSMDIDNLTKLQAATYTYDGTQWIVASTAKSI
jgi:hypothetical protein